SRAGTIRPDRSPTPGAHAPSALRQPRRARALTQALRTPPHAPHGEHAPSPKRSVPHHTPRPASARPHALTPAPTAPPALPARHHPPPTARTPPPPPAPHPTTRPARRARALTQALRPPPHAPHGEHAPSPKRSVPHHTPGRVHGASSAVTVPVPGSPPVPV